MKETKAGIRYESSILLYELCACRARTDLIIAWDLVRWLALCACNNNYLLS